MGVNLGLKRMALALDMLASMSSGANAISSEGKAAHSVQDFKKEFENITNEKLRRTAVKFFKFTRLLGEYKSSSYSTLQFPFRWNMKQEHPEQITLARLIVLFEKEDRKNYQKVATYISKQEKELSKAPSAAKQGKKELANLLNKLETEGLRGASEQRGSGSLPKGMTGSFNADLYTKALKLIKDLFFVIEKKEKSLQEDYTRFIPHVWVNPHNPIPVAKKKAVSVQYIKPIVVIDPSANYGHGDLCWSFGVAAVELGCTVIYAGAIFGDVPGEFNSGADYITKALSKGKRVIGVGSGCVGRGSYIRDAWSNSKYFFATIFKRGCDCGCNTLKVEKGGVEEERVLRFSE